MKRATPSTLRTYDVLPHQDDPAQRWEMHQHGTREHTYFGTQREAIAAAAHRRKPTTRRRWCCTPPTVSPTASSPADAGVPPRCPRAGVFGTAHRFPRCAAETPRATRSREPRP